MGYSIVNSIARVRILCHKVLPAVYDESLSYLEQLAKLAYKVNEVIDATNQLNENVDVLNDSVIDLNNRVTNVENQMAGFEAEMTQKFDELTATINANVDAKLNEVDVKIADIDNRMDVIEQNVDREMREFEALITSRINALEKELTDLVNDALAQIYSQYSVFEARMRDYVEEEIQKALEQIPDLTNIYVIDPTTGKLEKVQTAIRNIFEFSAYYALTVDEFNKLGLSINELNSLMVNGIPRGLTIYEWLRSAKKILLMQIENDVAREFSYPHSFVNDYLDGSLVWHDRNVDVNQMLIAAGGCYSCDELVTMAFTVDEIVGFAITCQQFVLRANSLMVR